MTFLGQSLGELHMSAHLLDSLPRSVLVGVQEHF